MSDLNHARRAAPVRPVFARGRPLRGSRPPPLSPNDQHILFLYSRHLKRIGQIQLKCIIEKLRTYCRSRRYFFLASAVNPSVLFWAHARIITTPHMHVLDVASASSRARAPTSQTKVTDLQLKKTQREIRSELITRGRRGTQTANARPTRTDNKGTSTRASERASSLSHLGKAA